MSLITRVYSFTDGTVAYGSQVDAEIATIVNALNSLDQAGTTWTNVKVTTLLPQADVNMGGHKLTSVGTPTTSGDAAVYPITASQITASTITNAQILASTIRGSTANSGGAAQEVSQGTVSTPDFRANAVTLTSQSSTSNGSSSTSITSTNITTIGGKVLIVATASLAGVSATSIGKARGVVQMNLNRGGTNLASSVCALGMDNTANSFIYTWPVSIVYIDSPAAGTYTYQITYDSTASGSVTSYNLSAVELRA